MKQPLNFLFGQYTQEKRFSFNVVAANSTDLEVNILDVVLAKHSFER